MRYKKKTVLMSLFTALQFCGAVSCVEFEPKKCPELSATVYSGNNGFAVMCVKTDGYADSGLGFDYAGLSTSGSPSRDSWTTRLLLKMGTGKSAQLNFLMTFPKGAAKQSDRFLIQADDPLGQPEKLYPLPIKYADSGKLVFHSFCLIDDI